MSRDLSSRATSRGHLPEWAAPTLLERGYTTIPNDYRRLFPIFSSIEQGVLFNIMVETIGGRRDAKGQRPEWIAIKREEFAKLLRCSVNGIDRAIAILEASGAIERRKHGSSKQYRARIEDFHELDQRCVPDAFKGDPKDQATAALNVMVMMPGQKKARPLDELCRCHHEHNCQLVHPETAAAEEKPVEKNRRKAIAKQVDTDKTLTVHSDYPGIEKIFEHFSRELTTTMTELVAAPPPPKFIYGEFYRMVNAGVPIPAFWNRVRLRSKAIKSWGFISGLVADTIETHAGAVDYRNAKPADARPANEVFAPANIRRWLQRAYLNIRSAIPKAQHVFQMIESLKALPDDRLVETDATERRLGEIESEVLALAHKKLLPDQVAAINAEIALDLEAYAGKMSRDQLAQLTKQFTDRKVMDRFQIPRLSFFYIELVPETKLAAAGD